VGDVSWTDYWRARGRRYEAEFVRSAVFEQQERALLNVLAHLEYDSVLEVGCGFGRITALVMEREPSLYTAIDVSADMLASARARIPRVDFVQSSILDYKPGRQWDLVLAVEVLMHVPPHEIEATINTMRSMSARHLVTLDYVGDRPLAAHNWKHDYARLLPNATTIKIGDQAIFVWSR
jgi:trans-aconitate methyltransferase